MKIQILGTGCAKCQALTRNADEAAKSLGLEYTIEKITDVNDILSYDVMMTPALAIDGKVQTTGRVPSVPAIAKILSERKAD